MAAYKSFAEKIIDSLVDKNGHCEDRYVSARQFDFLHPYMDLIDEESAGGYYNPNTGAEVAFSKLYYKGRIGRYEVEAECFWHFNPRYRITNIDTWIDEIPDTHNSEYQHNIKDRVDLSLMLLGYSYYDTQYGTTYIYRMCDKNNNEYIWKTSKFLDVKNGDIINLKGTVKAHNEYKGTKQTVLTRCAVNDIIRYKKAL